MNTTRGFLRIVAAAGVSLVLGGCMVTYQADVKNESDKPIEALIVHSGPVNEMTQSKKFIGPNDSGLVGPLKESSHRTILLIVQEPGSPGTAEKMVLSGGTTAVTVQRMGPQGRLVITETRKP